MDTRVAVIGIVVENENSVQELNTVLHAYGIYIIGRMGIPYRERGVILSALRSTRRRRLFVRYRVKSESFPASVQKPHIPI